MVCRTKNNEWGFEGYQPEKPKKVYCEYCKYFKHDKTRNFESLYNCKLERHVIFQDNGPEQIYKPKKKYYRTLIIDKALEKNKNNDCPDFKPKLRYKLLGKV